MIAALPMYDRAETAAANDRFWALVRDGLRARGIDAPDALRRGDADLMPQWLSPDLVLSQTCGFPYRARLHGRVQLVGTPDYGVEGCPPGHYRSILIAHPDDPRGTLAAFDGAAMAYNDGMSQSGWAAAQNHAAQAGIRLAAGPETGSHRASFLAVAEGRAALAAIDAVTFAYLSQFDAARDRVKVIGATDPTPGLPYVCALAVDAGAVLAAVESAIPALSPQDRALLRLKRIVQLPPAAYLAVASPAIPSGGTRGK
ncbi:MAG: hypothetical protein RIR62_128 [Pseudomonadota bacterium]